MRASTLAFVLPLLGCANARVPIKPVCSSCPAMQRIQPGNATFGSVEGARYQRPDELPRRVIRIVRPFAVSRFEITRGQYAAFVKATNHAVGGNCLTDRVKRGDWQYDGGTTFLDPGFTQADDHPVVCISYDDAVAYVTWLNTVTAGGYRLLSEVEWEYVAAAGVRTLFPWGDDASKGCRFANGFDETIWEEYRPIDTSAYPVFDPLPCRDGWMHTNPVGALEPNKFGVFDMIGNVSEWVADCYTASHDRLDANGRAASPDIPCAKRIAKGGSWGTLAHNLRTAERFPYAATHRDDSIGLRIARDVDSTGR